MLSCYAKMKFRTFTALASLFSVSILIDPFEIRPSALLTSMWMIRSMIRSEVNETLCWKALPLWRWRNFNEMLHPGWLQLTVLWWRYMSLRKLRNVDMFGRCRGGAMSMKTRLTASVREVPVPIPLLMVGTPFLGYCTMEWIEVKLFAYTIALWQTSLCLFIVLGINKYKQQCWYKFIRFFPSGWRAFYMYSHSFKWPRRWLPPHRCVREWWS